MSKWMRSHLVSKQGLPPPMGAVTALLFWAHCRMCRCHLSKGSLLLHKRTRFLSRQKKGNNLVKRRDSLKGVKPNYPFSGRNPLSGHSNPSSPALEGIPDTQVDGGDQQLRDLTRHFRSVE
ncbi:hypothetical protein AVEN_20687-1 [Araneus ventricosus]|uniref:Uncharacterized protein n=1 Tax=Araneus ventricosus TaxID=182803 RepID=A0A4Y2VV73_ARAVE|nr:hypothetical protein AVEN_20687-1 [Araneus ventricosus]